MVMTDHSSYGLSLVHCYIVSGNFDDMFSEFL